MFIDYTYPLVVQCVSLIVPFLHELHRCILQSAVDNQHSIVEYTPQYCVDCPLQIAVYICGVHAGMGLLVKHTGLQAGMYSL